MMQGRSSQRLLRKKVDRPKSFGYKKRPYSNLVLEEELSCI
jgi:hypothetical protein